MSGQLFAANVRLAFVDALGNLPTGGAFFGPINCPKLSINTPAPDNPQQISRQIGSVGQIKSQAFIPKPTDIQMEFDDLSEQRVLGFAFNGTVGSVAQAASTASAQALTLGALGDGAYIGARDVTSFVLKDSTGTTTYVLGTDYVFDSPSGFVVPLKGGAITAGASVEWSGTVPALSGVKVAGATVTSQFLRVDADMQSLVDGTRWRLLVPLYQANASGNLDLMGKNMLVAALSGRPIVLAGQDSFSLTQYTGP